MPSFYTTATADFYILMHYNDETYRDRIEKNIVETKTIQHILGSAYFLDSDPIEYVWYNVRDALTREQCFHSLY